MPLIKHGQVVPDPWVPRPDEGMAPASGGVIVSLGRLRAEHEALAARGELLGVRLAGHEAASELAEYLAHKKAMDEFRVWHQVAADDRQPAAQLRGLGRAAR